MQVEKQTCVVMTGEGARGAYQAALLHHLEVVNGLEFSRLYGISSGATNCFCRSHQGITGPTMLWGSFKKLTDAFGFSLKNALFGNGLFTHKKPLERTKTALRGGAAKIPYTVGMMDIEAGEMIYVRSEDLSQMSIDEAAELLTCCVRIPGLVSCEKFTDTGGLELNPISEAIKDGFKEIHLIVGVMPDQKGWEPPKKRFLKQLDYAFRSMDLSMKLMMFDNLCVDLPKGVTVHLYGPKEKLTDQLSFYNCQNMIAKGSEYRHIVLDSENSFSKVFSQMMLDEGKGKL